MIEHKTKMRMIPVQAEGAKSDSLKTKLSLDNVPKQGQVEITIPRDYQCSIAEKVLSSRRHLKTSPKVNVQKKFHCPYCNESFANQKEVFIHTKRNHLTSLKSSSSATSSKSSSSVTTSKSSSSVTSSIASSPVTSTKSSTPMTSSTSSSPVTTSKSSSYMTSSNASSPVTVTSPVLTSPVAQLRDLHLKMEDSIQSIFQVNKYAGKSSYRGDHAFTILMDFMDNIFSINLTAKTLYEVPGLMGSILKCCELKGSDQTLLAITNKSNELLLHIDTVLKQKTVTGRNKNSLTRCDKGSTHLKKGQKKDTNRIFVCPLCPYRTVANSQLIIHQRKHSGENPFTCPICNKMYALKTRLKKHMDETHGDKRFNCSHCEKTFSSKYSILVHERTHTGEKPYECKICAKAFINSSNLKKHEKTHRNESNKDDDNDLEEGTNVKKSYVKTKFVTSKLQKNVNNIEKSSEPRSERTDNHIEETSCVGNISTENSAPRIPDHSEIQYRCRVCKKSFISEPLLNAHPCSIKQLSVSGTLLNAHPSSNKVKSYPCSYCSRQFSNRGNLKVHEQSHRHELGNKEKCFACSYCSRKFSNRGNLKVHIQAHKEQSHRDENTFVCKLCNISFERKIQLILHEKRHVKCKICHRTFAENDLLKEHEKSCIYKCHSCTKSFATRSRLTAHEMVHNNERVHVCTVCNQAFKTRQHLKRHELSHADDTPFTCNVCHKGFRRKDHLMKHEKSHGNLISC